VSGAAESEAYHIQGLDDIGGAIGTLVSIDTSASSTAHVTQKSYDSTVLGVLNNSSQTLLGREYSDTGKVAIGGRTMVNVTSENGAIKPGDPITSGSIAGYGMKASKPGFIIGHALESLDAPLASSTTQCSQAVGTSTPVCQGSILVALSVGFSMNTDEGPSTLATALAVPGKLVDALGELASGVFEKAVQFVSVVADRIVAKVAIFGDLFADHLTATVINADTVNAKTLCLEGVCVSKSQLQDILTGSKVQAAPAPIITDTSDVSTTNSNAPVLSVTGNNPATIQVGSVYSDLGATIIGPTSTSSDLGIKASVDGGEPRTLDQISIDTTAAGSHTIIYSATDSAGNTGTATRIVNVVSQLTVSSVATSTAPIPDVATSTSPTDSITGTSTDPTSSPQVIP
jgi:hypothetical protein